MSCLKVLYSFYETARHICYAAVRTCSFGHILSSARTADFAKYAGTHYESSQVAEHAIQEMANMRTTSTIIFETMNTAQAKGAHDWKRHITTGAAAVLDYALESQNQLHRSDPTMASAEDLIEKNNLLEFTEQRKLQFPRQTEKYDAVLVVLYKYIRASSRLDRPLQA